LELNPSTVRPSCADRKHPIGYAAAQRMRWKRLRVSAVWGPQLASLAETITLLPSVFQFSMKRSSVDR